MDDKTMLELAARAACLQFQWGREWHDKDQPHVHGRYWNPLTDDGDALRLAVKLGIEPKFLSATVQAVVVTDPDGDAWETCLAEQEIGNDKLAATRRAIVRAAAEIGKAMGRG